MGGYRESTHCSKGESLKGKDREGGGGKRGGGLIEAAEAKRRAPVRKKNAGGKWKKMGS